ncbi:MAG TPA: PilZ domain-containing protein [Terriglobales bacterium]|nr:PilZ domain-containing protein [Terriglobales bacterium]
MLPPVPDRRRKNEPRQPERRNQNRRAFPRWERPFEVRYGTGKELAGGQGVEISENGMAFTGDRPCELGAELDVRYRLNPEEDWVRVRCVVRHIEANIVYGVEFLNLRLPDRLNILDYVSAKS